MDYYFRCPEEDAPALKAELRKLGVLDEGGNSLSGAFDEIGRLYEPTGIVIDTEEGPMREHTALLDADGRVMWHANLRHPSIEEAARALDTPEASMALTFLYRWLVLGADGNPTLPANPARVFA